MQYENDPECAKTVRLKGDQMKTVDFRSFPDKHIHMIGIGGASMSGIAEILKARGYQVTGSDRAEGESIRRLREKGVDVTVGHAPGNVEGADLAVYSLAIPKDHVELHACKQQGIPVIERSVLLGQLTDEFKTSIAVCGTHGKTTVTSMLAQILVEMDMDPAVHIGGVLNAIGGSVRNGHGDIMVTEACEYRRSFMNLNPTQVILLNIDQDHMDYYRDLDEIEDAFGDFLKKLPADGWALGNGDDPRVCRQLEKLRCSFATFGTSSLCDYRMTRMDEDDQGRFSFVLEFQNSTLGQVRMAIPGIFNAKNGAAALAAAHHLKLDMSKACEILGKFQGAHRRFERTGLLNGAELFHDYGHNPVEIRNVLSIARKRCRSGQLWAVVQPHTYSRVKTMFEEYLTCTEEADITLVTDIFAAREEDPGDLDSGMLVDAMKRQGINAFWTPSFSDAASAIRAGAGPGDLVITLGCGDIYQLNEILCY